VQRYFAKEQFKMAGEEDVCFCGKERFEMSQAFMIRPRKRGRMTTNSNKLV